jgi:hypothetical protein
MTENDLFERSQIKDLLIRYFGAIDDKCLTLSIIETTFTEDACIIRPNGSALHGHKNIFESQSKSFTRFKATHHVTSDYIIDLDNNVAKIRSNLTAMHLWADNVNNPSLNNKHFLAGAVIFAKAIKIDNTWKLSELRNQNVWRTGDGMIEMANFERP